jgi:predicted methyltransferase
MGLGQPEVSPVIREFSDYIGRSISITVSFAADTRLIQTIQVHRDAGCLFSTILLGVGEDGIPDHTDKLFNVPFGDRSVTVQQLAALAARGIATIEDFDSVQITAGL